MFNISFSELILILIIAFIALGPEKLPKALYILGTICRKLTQQYNNINNEFNSITNQLDLSNQANTTTTKESKKTNNNGGNITNLPQELIKKKQKINLQG